MPRATNAIATTVTQHHTGSKILIATPTPKARQNKPIVFLKAPQNTFTPLFLTNNIKYCKIFNIYYERILIW
jgi:hypothetical protein